MSFAWKIRKKVTVLFLKKRFEKLMSHFLGKGTKADQPLSLKRSEKLMSHLRGKEKESLPATPWSPQGRHPRWRGTPGT